MFCRCCTPRSLLQATASDTKGFVDPEDPNYPYFPLRDCPVELANRAAFWLEEGESIKDLLIFKITFTAVGVATLFPSVLFVQPGTEQTRYRFSSRLCKSFKSSDDQLLYSISTEWLQVI